jgi:hypothetical protein
VKRGRKIKGRPLKYPMGGNNEKKKCTSENLDVTHNKKIEAISHATTIGKF